MKSRFIDKCMLAFYSRFDKPDRVKKHIYLKRVYGIEIGKYTYGYNVTRIAKGTKIGSFCSIAPGVSIGLMNHPTENVSSHPFLYYKSRGFVDHDLNLPQKSAAIEDDVWLGTNAIIMPGVTVGQGAVIGAGAVVTKDVPPYAVAVGVPARIIRYRFDEDTAARLSRIKWADWDDDKIKDNLSLFYDPAQFIKECEKTDE